MRIVLDTDKKTITVAGLFSSLTLYGFGELIEKVSIIADQVKK